MMPLASPSNTERCFAMLGKAAPWHRVTGPQRSPPRVSNLCKLHVRSPLVMWHMRKRSSIRIPTDTNYGKHQPFRLQPFNKSSLNWFLKVKLSWQNQVGEKRME